VRLIPHSYSLIVVTPDRSGTSADAVRDFQRRRAAAKSGFQTKRFG
jgi:hypothetical protein